MASFSTKYNDKDPDKIEFSFYLNTAVIVRKSDNIVLGTLKLSKEEMIDLATELLITALEKDYERI